MSLGSNLRQLRTAKGWTQSELSQRTGIKIGHISALEQDDGDPKLSTLHKLLNALGCSPNELLLDPVEMPTTSLILSMVLDRVQALRSTDQLPLIDVLDRYCVACEMAAVMAQRASDAALVPAGATQASVPIPSGRARET